MPTYSPAKSSRVLGIAQVQRNLRKCLIQPPAQSRISLKAIHQRGELRVCCGFLLYNVFILYCLKWPFWEELTSSATECTWGCKWEHKGAKEEVQGSWEGCGFLAGLLGSTLVSVICLPSQKTLQSQQKAKLANTSLHSQGSFQTPPPWPTCNKTISFSLLQSDSRLPRELTNMEDYPKANLGA